ncbi:PglZ domain-containing protein [Desulfobulbus alkaliphilus]|uniref:PglZ domain-containing protein n=1 Tax=Desulfobulbus alkaliphilus TaxID=869814 RepID=UPI0019642897|nr:PglZ domain-containing protein [Desulfobulbus alkaliphilus]MBM9538654.1 PglZ domain-containing protein [Desulfobulbus alkaliphilus]
MTLRDYIHNQVFARRLQEHAALVIYDPTRRYRDIALGLATDQCRVIDASLSVIEQRELATEALNELAEGQIHHLVIWIPARPPQDVTASQSDPFAVFASIGAVFPQGDGDDYASICRLAKPDHVPEINRLFAQGEPSFELIDALDKGGSWPTLKTLLRAGSAREILLGVLAPNGRQEAALKNDPTWVGEFREYCQRSLGHKLKTRGQTRQSIADELWQVVLFSEFFFDSGEEMPPELTTVPRVGDEARNLAYEVCNELRKHQDHIQLYFDQALEVEERLQLAACTSVITRLGERDTFSFAERIFLQRMVDKALDGDLDGARKIAKSRQKSIWLSQEERLAEWLLANRALELLDIADRLSTPKYPTLETIVHGYALTWRDLDRHHREMEQAALQCPEDHDGLENLVQRARREFSRSVAALQAEFIRLAADEGWPVSSGRILRNNQLFNRLVTPALDQGENVAYFLVDSLRFELGVELEKQLSDKQPSTLHTVCAQLPTYTEVGMASLMPDAETALNMVEKGGKLVTTLNHNPAINPVTRLEYLKSIKGDQCMDIELEDLLRKKKIKLPAPVRLLLVRTRDIDTIAHGSPSQALQMIPGLLRQILRGLNKVADLGFTKAVIATDHGFILFPEQEAGNVAPKPEGRWLVEKSRCLLGEGEEDGANLVLKRTDVGIPGTFAHYAVPRALVPYSRGQMFYHEGLSLQECVLPCLTVELQPSAKGGKKQVPVALTLTYRQGKIDKITSRRPVLDLAWPQAVLPGQENEIEVAVEVVDVHKAMVGSVGSGQTVNPATGCVRIKSGSAISFGLRMDDEFSGSFTIRILDPATSLQHVSLNLKTGYLE